MISIIIPSWDDYRYLKPCLESIVKYTKTEYEILIHLNTYNDQLCEIAELYDSKYTKSENNLGIATATNMCAVRAKGNFLYFPNSDMIFLPDWDTYLLNAIDKYGSNNVYSSTMIEPRGNNRNFIIRDYGTEPETLNHNKLLLDVDSLRTHEYKVMHTVPYLIPTSQWVPMDERMWPGWVTDDDIVVSIFTQDPDVKFIQVTDSLVYHFMCKCTHKIGTDTERYVLGNKAKEIFDTKWGKIYHDMNCENYRRFIYSDFK